MEVWKAYATVQGQSEKNSVCVCDCWTKAQGWLCWKKAWEKAEHHRQQQEYQPDCLRRANLPEGLIFSVGWGFINIMSSNNGSNKLDVSTGLLMQII